MPTLVAVLTLVALLKLSNVDMPRWHLAFWFGVLVGAALMGAMPRLHAVGHGLLSFVQAWVYFVLLDRTDNRLDRVWHWLTSTHLAAELFQSTAGIQMTHIPYKGTSQIAQDLLAGVIPLSFESSLTTTLPNVKEGKLKVIAVTSPQRSRALPNVPTVAESGFPGFDVVTWFGLIGPASLPKATIAKLADAWKAGAATSVATTAFENIGADIKVNTPQQFADFIRAESKRWGDLIRKLDIKLD